ncbi:RNA polymerase sigma factor [Mycobacterium phage Toaka]|nr:RNA polymerase sigma factor [Mycobacterium phage Toaka]
MTLIKHEQQHHDALQALYPVIQRAAKSVAFQWPGVVEEDDMVQLIAQDLWERPRSLMKLAAQDDAGQYKAVVFWGHRLANQERTDYDHYKGTYKYSVDEVKSLLSRGVLTQDIEGFTDAVIDLIDGLEAMSPKTPQYVDAITLRYADGEVPKVTKAKDALKNGLTALTNAMNSSNKRRFAGDYA